MVTAFKIAKNLNEVSLEELISALRSHEIELDANEPLKKGKSIALKSNVKKCTNAFQAREEDPEESESEEEEDELSMISRRVNQLWKSKQRKFRGFRSSKRFERGESSGDRRSDKKKAVCYECNEPGHYKNECPKLQKENPKKKFHKKKALMATWDDSESESESDSEGEQTNFTLMATEDDGSESTLESDSEEVFSELSREELVSSLTELLELKAHLSIKYKKLKKQFEFETKKLEVENSELKEKVLNLSKDSGSPSETEKSIPSMNHILKEYDSSFRKFLSRSICRSHLASMIYGVSGNKRIGIGYEDDAPHKFEHVDDLKITYKPLYEQFKYGHSHVIRLTSHAKSFHATHTKKHVTQPRKYHVAKPKEYHVVPPVVYYAKPKFNQNLRKTNNKGPKKLWVPKEKIIYVADILGSKEDKAQHVMVPGLWVLATHDGRRSMFQDMVLKSGGEVKFGGDQKGKIIGSGSISIGNSPSISNVLLVEGLTHNLLSISQLSDNGYDIIFNQKYCKAVSQKDGSILITGKRKNNIYKIDLSDLEKQKVTCLMSGHG